MSDTLKKLREPAALAAVAYAGLSLLAALLDLLLPPSTDGVSEPFANRAHDQTTAFLSVTVAAAVGFAVYLANEAGPALAKARLITLAALIEAALAALLGVISVLAQFGAQGVPGEDKFTRFLEGAGGAAVLAVAGWYTLTLWQAHAAARPKPAAPAGWPGGPGYPQQQTPPPGGFGWAPPQGQAPGQMPAQAPGQVRQPGQQPQGFGADSTQLLPPVPPAPLGGVPPQAAAQHQPPMQGYAPQAQPWSPGGAPQAPPPPQQPQPPKEHPENPFPIGDWQ